MARPAYKIDASNPGCDISMETAAAFAAGYMAFKDISIYLYVCLSIYLSIYLSIDTTGVCC